MPQAVLQFRDVLKRYGDYTAVDRVDFELAAGEFFTLLGPSGCGKTTTLRLVAGLEDPDDGEILLNGAPIAAPRRGILVPPDKRQMGMVFQSYAIWPHMTVFENVAFPLRVRGEAADAVKKKVLDALELVGLGGLHARGATSLSGGQQQRVALARALAYTPTILLLDEPLSNLDAKLREQMRFELRALQRRLNLTVLYVTHDQTEAMTLSDRIAVMRQGKIEQLGNAVDIYERPATAFVGDFLGRTVVLEGALKKDGGRLTLEFRGGERLSVGENHNGKFSDGDAMRIVCRPEDVHILPDGPVDTTEIKARVHEIAYLGDHLEYTVDACGRSIVVLAGKTERYAPGAPIRLAFDPAHLTLLRIES
ncbi:MAG TPA: ABC transporter ATP-binding protein [Candidatus Binatia bacterium]|jgi:ABC-type Fe3+/spermidine/putrescine transport system ATPase subunit